MILFVPDSQLSVALNLFLMSNRADCRELFVQFNQVNFNFKCRRQACFSLPPLWSYDGLACVELVRFPGKDTTNAVLSSLFTNK
jgi:hypothetical protein